MGFWEDVGESVGYGLAAVILGPRVALEKRTRRIRRRAFAAWLGDESFTKQVAKYGRIRRLVERTDEEGSFVLECELRYLDGRAQITIPLERPASQLPDEELAATVAASPLRHFDDPEVVVNEEALVVQTKAPQHADEWNALASGAVRVAAWIARRATGGGYR